jgi:hypothetical protein
MKQRLVIIGDSFAQPSMDESFYGYTLQRMFPDIDVINDGDPSRDAQTILDHWIKVIPELGSDDYLIVVFPALGRTRLPLVKKDRDDIIIGNIKLVNRFKGTDSYDNEEIELFGDSYDRKYFKNILIPQMTINASKASEDNFMEIVESLSKLTACKKYIFSWNEIDRLNIPLDDKQALVRKMGKWITLHSEFVRSGGKKGFKGDLHWSSETHIAFSNFISKEFAMVKKNVI